MLVLLLAVGALDAASGIVTGPVSVAAERMIAALRVQPSTVIDQTIPQGAYVWSQAFDPADHAPFAFDFSALLSNGETIAQIERIRMSATAAALGVMVEGPGTYGPIVDSATGATVQIWFVVDPALQDSASFDASGVRLPVSIRIRTSATPPRIFERTGVIVVRQQ